MEHLEYINIYRDSIVCFKYCGVPLSASNYNADHFNNRRSYRVIIKLRWMIFRHYINCNLLRRKPDIWMRWVKKSNCELMLRSELRKISIFKKLQFLYLVVWDILNRKCKYFTFDGKKILVYKKMEDVRL